MEVAFNKDSAGLGDFCESPAFNDETPMTYMDILNGIKYDFRYGKERAWSQVGNLFV